MGTSLAIVQQFYQAFGRGDLEAILKSLSEQIDWEFIVSPQLGYGGRRRSPAEVADFFAAVARLDNIQVFEPREFIEAGEHVTVLGFEKTTAIDTGKNFESEWLHLFTIKDGKITRFRGFFNTAARYGL